MASFMAQALKSVVLETASPFQFNPAFSWSLLNFTSPKRWVSVSLELSSSAFPMPVFFAKSEAKFSCTSLPMAEIAPMPVTAISITYPDKYP